MHDQFKDLLSKRKFKNIVVLTGAGISAESGIKTFRDANGLWENHKIEDVASFDAYVRDPEMVHRFYNLRRAQLSEVEPNPAHHALAKLESIAQKFTLITQNVDDLHERAGNKNILHMHGELRKIRDLNSNESKYWTENVVENDFTSCRPDIVWFGEQIKYAQEIEESFNQCDLYLCIGTSSLVYPAAGLVQAAKYAEAYCIEVNLEETPLSGEYDYNIFGKASKTLPELIGLL